MSEQKDVIVIGAGPAGYVCAIRLAQLGKKVTVIDKAELGGVCLNRGCIPSKALIYAGTLFEKMRHASEMGLFIQGAKVDLPILQKWKESVVKKLTGGVGTLLKANGCEVIAGEAAFQSPTEIEVKTKGETKVFKFNQCVVATGSRPTPLKGFEIDHKKILDSTSALNLDTLPKSLLCIGGGYIGLELGTFYAKIGSKVTVAEAAPALLGAVDPELTRVVEKNLKKRGVEIHTKTFVKGVSKKGSELEVKFEDSNGKSFSQSFEKVLVTVGRTPNTEGLGLEKAGIRFDGPFIGINARLQTDIPNIYAIGDVAGQPLLAHKGSKEGIVCAEVIAGKRVVYDVRAMPAVIFTDPEIATVGLSEAEAREKGIEIQVGQFPFAANGRALSVSEPDGFVKLIGEKKTGRLLGAHIVGAEASNLIAEPTLGLEMGATIEDLALTVHAHPTLPEVVMEGAEATLGHAIHVVQKKPRPKPSPEPQVSP